MLLVSLSIFTTACDQFSRDDDGSGSPGVYATTPDQSCLYSSNCNYPNTLPMGWSNYPQDLNGYYTGYNNQFNNGFCGCPWGTQPVYNSQYGLACVSNQQVYPDTYTYNYWQWGQSGFTTFSTYSGVGYNVYRNNNCWQGVLSACVVGSTCMSGTCRLVPGTQYGLCSQ